MMRLSSNPNPVPGHAASHPPSSLGHRRFSRREVAGALEREILTAAVIIADAARGLEITEERRQRLMVAARRCSEAAKGVHRVR